MKKRLKVFLACFLALILLLGGGFFAYVSVYYRAQPEVQAILDSSPHVKVSQNLTILSPDEPGDIGFIFYPGGKVEHTAYLPLLHQLRLRGITCILVEMPFNLAFFNKNAARDVMEQFPDISRWYLGGHSLGGAMASSFFADNPQNLEGLILLGAFLYGDVDPAKALIIYGSEDQVLSRDKIDPETQNVYVIPGGNHAQFGNYGPQKGDGVATITAQEQQQLTAERIVAFIQQGA